MTTLQIIAYVFNTIMRSDKKRAQQVFSRLEKEYPKARIILKYSNNFELLVSVILSAQTTDKQVNKVTAKLFKKYKTIRDYAQADLKQLQKDIRSIGLYNNKAKYIQGSAVMILNKYGGKVPDTMEKLICLPGVARKTANIVLGNAFDKFEGVAVDTHVKRLSNRLGFSQEDNPEKIERDLMKLFINKQWFKLTYLLIEHGRAICQAKKPKCSKCVVNKLCPSAVLGNSSQNRHFET